MRYCHGEHAGTPNKNITDLPAEVTVDSGSLSLDARNDIRNGTREIWLIAFKALFEVSLVFPSKYHTRSSRMTKEDAR